MSAQMYDASSTMSGQTGVFRDLLIDCSKFVEEGKLDRLAAMRLS